MNPAPIIIVNRDRFRLYVQRWNTTTNRWRRSATYKIAIGKKGAETPEGPYVVLSKSLRPDWKVPPNPDYPESIWGDIYKFKDPRNPFAGGFISLGGHPRTKGDGVGFHGTKFDPKLGTRASHGCVRMAVEDFLDLYDRVEVGTVVYVD
jgi:lipoprotein-anchoring transpeptidase ErfK/SrfK